MSGTEPAHHSTSLQPELVLLGLLVQQECHGYELYRRFSATLAGLWHISESQMYATLRRLEDKKFLVTSSPGEGLAVSRRILSPTSTGKARFESWLAGPSPCRPRTLRLEFLTRLFLARQLAPDSVPALIETQRSSVLECLKKMQQRQGKPGQQDPGKKQDPARRQKPMESNDPGIRVFDICRLADDFTTAQLRSAIEWIDESIIPGIQEDRR